MTTPLAGRPTFAAIDAAALRANFAAVRALLPAHVAVVAVVKANAYGHGAALTAPIFEAAGADYLGVATIEEGVELRAAGVRKPILVLTGARAGDISACHEHQLSVESRFGHHPRPAGSGDRRSVHGSHNGGCY